MSLLPLLCLKFLIFCIIGPKIFNSSPSSLPKNVKNNNETRTKIGVFCSPELYYFKEDRAKAVNKSYPQIFFMIAKS